ncbi:MAG: DNA polymerase III subunit delta' [Deltaproteobacteria bacterium]|jgi:DNA polymerase-3 subunit delta'|nr:DNA polymerase III subunit delta' [Deltaproteobacteria bacterium]
MCAAERKKKPEHHTRETFGEPDQHVPGVRAFAGHPRFANIRASLAILGRNPPQSLLLEGGSARDRLVASLYWAALLNCANAVPQPGREADRLARPCLLCPSCLSFVNLAHRDLFFFNGGTSSITIEDVRASGISSSLGEKPASASRRVVLFYEGQSFNEVSANAFLKALEEPQIDTVFVLTAPQRERLLQTLVSRSWTLTLPWPDPHSRRDTQNTDGDAAGEGGSGQLFDLAEDLLDFAAGKNSLWMERIAQKGVLDKYLAMQIVLFCQKALLTALAGKPAREDSRTEDVWARAFSALPPARLHIVNEALAECQDCLGESLKVPVNPALTLNWLATRLFFVFNSNPGAARSSRKQL